MPAYKSSVHEARGDTLVTVHLEHTLPWALHQRRPYRSHFLESLLLPIFCVFTYAAITDPPRKHDPRGVQSGRWGKNKFNNNLTTKTGGHTKECPCVCRFICEHTKLISVCGQDRVHQQAFIFPYDALA